MDFDGMIKFLEGVNNESEDPLPESILKEILALSHQHPLDSDRADCQKKISELIRQGGSG